jgi:hypothetical protein
MMRFANGQIQTGAFGAPPIEPVKEAEYLFCVTLFKSDAVVTHRNHPHVVVPFAADVNLRRDVAPIFDALLSRFWKTKPAASC